MSPAGRTITRPLAFPVALIHRSAWKWNSWKFTVAISPSTPHSEGIGTVERLMYAYTDTDICLRQGRSTTPHIYTSVLQALADGAEQGA